MQVADALPGFADAFPFEEFNAMQREAVPALLDSDENVVASAPTASGKTALAELAICRTLEAGGTALFIAPLRALTNEKESEWDRFERLGYSVYVVTGERDFHPRRAETADILVMTPEKADSATRKHDSPRYGFITDVDCCVIDEVHLLDSDRRGAVLEVTIARLRRLCEPRIVALSATMRNVEEIARWLDAPPATTFDFGEQYRPVDLHADVTTYANGENAFADKYRRLYRALDLAEPHLREDGQALVFVASRQDTVRAAAKARDELAERDVPVGSRGDFEYHTETQQLANDALRQAALDGVAFHHAGLGKSDRDLVERWFREGHVRLLFSTSTLAWGVNLPARCVIIRDTKIHDPLEGEIDMSPIDVLQMLGRAGRPDYDDVGYGWVICESEDADRYRRLLRDGKAIDSRLADDLDAHLTAEVALGTVSDLEDLEAWLETTFYFVRATSDPEAYGLDGMGERLRAEIDGLVDRGFVALDEDGSLAATPLGELASAYYLRLPTAERFHALATSGAVGEDAVLRAVARASEFDSVSARQAEREAIVSVLPGSDMDLDPGERKVMAICRTAMRGTTPSELASDAWVIKQNALRLLGALRAMCDRFASAGAANVVRRVSARLEHGVSPDAVALTAVDGIGPGRASRLAGRGLSTPADVVDAGVDGLREAGFAEGVAERLVGNAAALPRIEVDWDDLPETIERGENAFHEVTVASSAGRARAGVTVTVNGVEMSRTEAYLGSTRVPVAIHGGETETLTYAVEVVFPDLPLEPVVEARTVRVEAD